MTEAIQTELDAVVGWVEEAKLSPGAKTTLAWCLNQLPALAQAFGRTYENRYTEEALRLEKGMLCKLAEENASEFAEALIERLRGLHERIGFPQLDLKPRPAPTPLPRKKRKAG